MEWRLQGICVSVELIPHLPERGQPSEKPQRRICLQSGSRAVRRDHKCVSFYPGLEGHNRLFRNAFHSPRGFQRQRQRRERLRCLDDSGGGGPAVYDERLQLVVRDEAHRARDGIREVGRNIFYACGGDPETRRELQRRGACCDLSRGRPERERRRDAE